MFDSGPARDVSAIPRRSLSKLRVFIGTGLLHPNRNMIMLNAPMGSICARGFIVKRPYAFGVGSPSLTAVSAWAYSWIVEAINIDGIAKSIQYIVSDVRKFIF